VAAFCLTDLLDVARLEESNQRIGDIRFTAVRQARKIGLGAFAIQE
jgi:hypothetical protein